MDKELILSIINDLGIDLECVEGRDYLYYSKKRRLNISLIDQPHSWEREYIRFTDRKNTKTFESKVDLDGKESVEDLTTIISFMFWRHKCLMGKGGR